MNAASVSQAAPPQPIATSHTAHSRLHAEEPTMASPTSTDGWGDAQDQTLAVDDDEKDGWGDMDLPAEPAPPPALARIRAAQQRPVASSTSTTAKVVTKLGEVYKCIYVFVQGQYQ